MKHRATAGLVLVSLMLLPGISSADPVIVDYDGIPPNFSNLQDGIDAAPDGGLVYVIATLSTGPEQVFFRGPRNRGLDFGDKNITLQSFGGAQKFAIDCQGLDRAFLLSSGVDTTSQIIGFTLMNGTASGGGGAVRCEGGTPRFTGCVFKDNSAGYGGAASLAQELARFTDCEFYRNSATGDGGAIHALNSELRLNACTFGSNTASGGGGIWLSDSDLTIKLCTFTNNEASVGSSVQLHDSTATIEQCVMAFGREDRALYGGTPETFHSCVFGNDDGDELPGNAHDNLFVDPRLCDFDGSGTGAMSLCGNSPCLPGGNPWVLQIGSKVQGCGECDSPVRDASWGSIKALFR